MTREEIKAHLKAHPWYQSRNRQSAERYGIPVSEFIEIKKEIRAEADIDIAASVGLPDNFKVRRAWQGGPDGELRFSFEQHTEDLSSDEKEEFRQALLSDIREEMQQHPAPAIQPSFPNSGNMAVIHFCDLHLGKDAWDLDEAIFKIQSSFEYALAFARLHQCERIHLPLGHDLLQIDYEHIARSGTLHTTSSGTPVTRSNASWRELYREGRKLGSWMIRRAREEGVFVTVDIIPGNHSEQSEIAMGDAWQVQFEDDPQVDIRIPDEWSKSGGYELALQWGEVGIMETHGDNIKFEDLPTHFAFRFPNVFCHSSFRYVLTGHKHISAKRRVGDFVEDRGCNVYISPSLSPQDLWHKKYGYDGLPGFDVFIYNKETGPIGHYQHRVPEKIAA